MDGNNGHRIFVKLYGNAKIWLHEGEDFMVLDANGTDNDGAAFQLPNPDPDNDGVTEYSAWARALGRPAGISTTTTCAYDTDGVEWCSVYSMVLVREKGKSSFTNVSKEPLYIYVDLDGDGCQLVNSTDRKTPGLRSRASRPCSCFDMLGISFVQAVYLSTPKCICACSDCHKSGVLNGLASNLFFSLPQ